LQEIEQLKAKNENLQQKCEQFRKRLFRLKKKISPKKKRRNSIILFTELLKKQRRRRLQEAKQYLIDNIVGNTDKGGLEYSYSEQEKIFEKDIKADLLDVFPTLDGVSPLTLKTVVKKIPKS
jgi:hypothetical protein